MRALIKTADIAKYLIILFFLLAATMASKPKVEAIQNVAPKAKEKGPVYHPLRAKPYTKYSMKA